MEVILDNISKRFGYQWIIRNCNFHFQSGSKTGISGINGSGKSTLIKIISSYLSPTEGSIQYIVENSKIQTGELFKHLTMVGPYTGLIGEYNIKEQFHFHFRFKKKSREVSVDDFIAWLELDLNPDKRIMDYSSGMHQRVQLGLTLLTDSKLLLLDEPTSFLDAYAKEWFYKNLESHSEDKTIIIASNDPSDFSQCQNVYDVMELKTVS